MKALVVGIMMVLAGGLAACSSAQPPADYGSRSLTDSRPAAQGPRINARKSIWKLRQQQQQEEMRRKAQENLNKRLKSWSAIHDRVAWQNALAEQKERERQAKARQRFAGFF